MSFPTELLYLKSHEWVRIEGDEAVIGISSFAAEQLGDITYVDLPKVGKDLSVGAELGSIESVKAASELYSPVDGSVIAVNDALEDSPETVNTDPFGAGWIVRVSLKNKPESLLDAAAYAELVASEAH